MYRVSLLGFSINFETIEEIEQWYEQYGSTFPEDPSVYYTDENGHEMMTTFGTDGLSDDSYHVVDGYAISDEDWLSMNGYSDDDLADFESDYSEVIDDNRDMYLSENYEDYEDFDDGLPF